MKIGGIVICFVCLFLVGCNDTRELSPQGDLIQSDSLSTQGKYNLEIRPSTKIRCDIIVERHKEKYINDKLYYVDATDTIAHKYRLRSVDSPNVRHHYSFLWPCNLPDIVNRGDTILVSGQAYVIYSNEQMIGLPFVIERILMHDNYGRGLNRLFN